MILFWRYQNQTMTGGNKKDMFAVINMLPPKFDGTSSAESWVKIIDDLEVQWDDGYTQFTI